MKSRQRGKEKTMKKLVLAAMMMGMIAVTPVIAHAASEEQSAATTQTTEAAQTTEAVEGQTEYAPENIMNWSDELQQQFVNAGFSGTFYTVDDLDLRLLVPEGLKQREATQEELATGIKVVFADEKNENTIKIRFGSVSGCKKLSEVAQLMNNNPEIKSGLNKINGLDTILVMSEKDNSVFVIIGAGEGQFVQVVCSPISNATMYEQFKYTLASLQSLGK